MENRIFMRLIRVATAVTAVSVAAACMSTPKGAAGTAAAADITGTKTKAAAAQSASRRPNSASHGHTIARFSATTHHRFEDVARWKKIFDDPTRSGWQKPADVIAALGLKPGDAVADLGSGTGYFLPYLTRAVGAAGVVYAVDVEPNLITYLRERSEKQGWSQVVPVLASLDNPRLPRGSLDVVLIVDTYHHLDNRRVYLRVLARALERGGRIAIVDWKKGEFPQGPPDLHKIARAQVAAEMREVGYRLVAEPAILPYQYMMIFASRSGAATGETRP